MPPRPPQLPPPLHPTFVLAEVGNALVALAGKEEGPWPAWNTALTGIGWRDRIEGLPWANMALETALDALLELIPHGQEGWLGLAGGTTVKHWLWCLHRDRWSRDGLAVTEEIPFLSVGLRHFERWGGVLMAREPGKFELLDFTQMEECYEFERWQHRKELKAGKVWGDSQIDRRDLPLAIEEAEDALLMARCMGAGWPRLGIPTSASLRLEALMETHLEATREVVRRFRMIGTGWQVIEPPTSPPRTRYKHRQRLS